MSIASRTCIPVLAALALSSSRPAGLSGQWATPDLKNAAFAGVGYVASLPNTFAGASVLALSSRLLGGAGVYADVKFSTSTRASDPYFLADVTPTQAELAFGDQRFSEEGTYLSANLAVVYAVTREFAVYAGGGYAHDTKYRQYFDDAQNRGELGFYWVRDPEDSGTYVNLLAGGLFRLGRRFLFQAGVDSRPVGATLGIVLLLPVG